MASIQKRKNSQWYYLVYRDASNKQVWKALPGMTKKQAEALAKRKTQEIAEQRRRLKFMALQMARIEDARGGFLEADSALTQSEIESIKAAELEAERFTYLSDEEEREMEEEARRRRLGIGESSKLPPALSIEHLTNVVFPGWL